jgi:DNA-directed RNA polymerase subunit K/omega
MTKTLSRCQEVNTEQCVRNVEGNRFEMILIAAARSREITKKNRDANPGFHTNGCIDALLEIQNGKIGREYLRKV